MQTLFTPENKNMPCSSSGRSALSPDPRLNRWRDALMVTYSIYSPTSTHAAPLPLLQNKSFFKLRATQTDTNDTFQFGCEGKILLKSNEDRI